MAYIVQITENGGPEGTKIVDADYAEQAYGGVTLYKDGKPVLLLSSFVAAWSDDANIQDAPEE